MLLIPVKARTFSSFQKVQTCPDVHLFLLSLLEIKRLDLEASHLPASLNVQCELYHFALYEPPEIQTSPVLTTAFRNFPRSFQRIVSKGPDLDLDSLYKTNNLHTQIYTHDVSNCFVFWRPTAMFRQPHQYLKPTELCSLQYT